MKKSILVLALAFGAAGWASEAAPTGPDFNYLYRRASESAFIVRASLEKSEGVVSKLRPIPSAADSTGDRIAELDQRGGILYTLAVRQVLSQRADWSAGKVERRTLDGPVHIFIPWEEPPVKPNTVAPFIYDRQEYFLPGKEYLLFLREDPDQETFLRTHKLDPKRAYYRAVWGHRGAVAIPTDKEKRNPRDFATPFISAVTAMCEAVRTPDPVARRVQLMQYMQIADPDLRPQIEVAIQAFEVPAAR